MERDCGAVGGGLKERPRPLAGTVGVLLPAGSRKRREDTCWRSFSVNFSDITALVGRRRRPTCASSRNSRSYGRCTRRPEWSAHCIPRDYRLREITRTGHGLQYSVANSEGMFCARSAPVFCWSRVRTLGMRSHHAASLDSGNGSVERCENRVYSWCPAIRAGHSVFVCRVWRKVFGACVQFCQYWPYRRQGMGGFRGWFFRNWWELSRVLRGQGNCAMLGNLS